jgi:hypothetical protein
MFVDAFLVHDGIPRFASYAARCAGGPSKHSWWTSPRAIKCAMFDTRLRLVDPGWRALQLLRMQLSPRAKNGLR